MARRCLLHLDSDGLRPWLWHDGTLHSQDFFPPDDAGHAAFALWLESHLDLRFTLVADCVEEGFQLDTIPHVLGADRKALIARKLAQFFYGSPYATAIPLGRDTGGRRDDRLLFLALTRPQMIEPWLDALRLAGAVLTGVTSAAVLLGHALAPLLRDQHRILVVCRTDAGLRQTLFEEGRLRFSRLATTPSAGPSWTGAIPFEVQKTYQYLVAQRAVARGTPLPVAVLADGADISSVRAACTDSELLQYLPVDLAPRAADLRLKAEPTQSSATPLLLHIAARRPDVIQFAPPRDRMGFRWWQAQRIVLVAGAAALALSLALSARIMFDTRALDDATAAIRLDAQARQLRYDRLLATLPTLPAPLDTLRGHMAVMASVERHAALPADALATLARALDQRPDITVQKIEWQLPAPGSGSLPPGTRDGGLPTDSGVPPAAPGTVQLTLHAGLSPDTPLSQREAVAAIEAFAATWREQGARETTVLRLPFDYTSDRTLRSATPAERGVNFVVRATQVLQEPPR